MQLWADGSLHFIFNPMKNFFFKPLLVKLFKASTSLFFVLFFFYFRAFHSFSLGINQGVTAASVTAHQGSLSVLFYAHFEENLSCFESVCQSEAVTPRVPPSLCATNPTVAACGHDSVCRPSLARLHRSGPTSLSSHTIVRPPTLGGTVASSVWKASEALCSSGTCCFSLAPLR